MPGSPCRTQHPRRMGTRAPAAAPEQPRRCTHAWERLGDVRVTRDHGATPPCARGHPAQSPQQSPDGFITQMTTLNLQLVLWHKQFATHQKKKSVIVNFLLPLFFLCHLMPPHTDFLAALGGTMHRQSIFSSRDLQSTHRGPRNQGALFQLRLEPPQR